MKRLTRTADVCARHGLTAILSRHGELLARHDSLLKAGKSRATANELAALDRQLTRLERRIITFPCESAQELKLKLKYLESLMAGDNYIRSILSKAVRR